MTRHGVIATVLATICAALAAALLTVTLAGPSTSPAARLRTSREAVAAATAGIPPANASQEPAIKALESSEQPPAGRPVLLTGPQHWSVWVGAEAKSPTVMPMGYYPEILTIDVGDTVTWTIHSMEPHTITFGPQAGPNPPTVIGGAAPEGGSTYGGHGTASSGFIMLGESYSLTFTASGVFPYHCALHPGMAGVVVVQPSGAPYPMSPGAVRATSRVQASLAISLAEKTAAAYAPPRATVVDGRRVLHVAAGLSPPMGAGARLVTPEGHTLGYATISEQTPTSATATVTLHNVAPHEVYALDLLRGVCGYAPAATVDLLSPITTANATSGTSTTTISPVYGVPAAGWYIQVVEENGLLASTIPALKYRVAGCGNVLGYDTTVSAFFPATIKIRRGDEVTWTNLSPEEIHTVTFKAPGIPRPSFHSLAGITRTAGERYYGGYANSGVLTPGQSYSLIFEKAGTFNYDCLVHDFALMDGTVVVKG